MSAEFEAAAAKVKTLVSDPGQDHKLRLYALYKQGTNDPAFEATSKPAFYDVVGKHKYAAWEKVVKEEKLSPEDAQKEYIKLVDELVASIGTK